MSLPNVVTALGDVRAHTRKVAEEIAHRWTLYFIWGIGPSGEHKQGRALDFMGYELGGGVDNPGRNRPEMLEEIAAYLWRHRYRLGVWYLILNRRIISMTYENDGWRPYDGSNPHINHVHVSFYASPPDYTPPEDDMPSEAEIWHHQIENYRIDNNGKRVKQGMRRAEDMLTDAEYTIDRVLSHAWRTAAQVRAQTRLLEQVAANQSGLELGEIRQAMREAYVDAAPELAAALAPLLDNAVDVGAVEAAIRQVFGSLDAEESTA